MHTTSPLVPCQSGLSLLIKSWTLPAILAMAALAAPARAIANPFAATSVSPSAQNVSVGTSCSVDVVFKVPPGGYVAYGIQAWLKFDPTKLQVVSVTAGGSSPFTNVFANQFDNTAGTINFGATGGNVANTTFTAATVVFTATGAGTSSLIFQNVNEYIAGYGPYGVNGSATGGSITVTAPPAVTVFASGISPVIAWDPIFPSALISPDYSESKPVPSVGYDDPRWTNPHAASVFPTNSHPWEHQGWVPAAFKFDANWINAWSNLNANGMGGPGQSWTKYSTMITGEGDFVLQFLADNASWIYIDGELIGFQDYNWSTNGTGRYTISLTGAGPHELSFIIWDGGGLAGGKFRVETVQSFQDNNPGEELPPPPPPSDSTPPVISAPANITTEATGPAGAAVSFAATANDDVDGPVSVMADPASGSTFPLGTTIVDLGASDAAGNMAFASFNVTVVDTTAPALSVPANLTVEATSASGATVTYAAATATDAVGVTSVTHSPASGSTFALGTTTVTASARDAAGNTSTGSFTVTVVDTTAPTFSGLTPSSATLWSPNHKMVPITLSALTSDNTGVTSLKIISVSSNEPDNGLGDGDTAGDYQITGDLSVNLRAERSGKGNGRIYTITVEASDASGNTSTRTCTVSVPKSQGKK